MAATPIYNFVTPDLANTADGPAAMAALATRVEREMSTFRSTTTHDPGDTVTALPGPSTDTVVLQVTSSTAVIGWIDIEFQCLLTSNGVDSYLNIGLAGYVKIYVDDVLVRTRRYHNQFGTRSLDFTMRAAVARTAAQTSTNLKAKVDVTPGSSAVNCFAPSFYVVQYGAPGSG
jgi:hypothetical protein